MLEILNNYTLYIYCVLYKQMFLCQWRKLVDMCLNWRREAEVPNIVKHVTGVVTSAAAVWGLSSLQY